MPYVTIREAAERLGVSQDTIRRRIKAGDIPAQQEPMGTGYRWLVEVPDDAQAETSHSGASAEGQIAADALELAALRARVVELERHIETLTRHAEELAADRDHWRDQANRSQVMVETAQRLAERAQVLQERAQPAALPAGGVDSVSPSADAADTTQPPSAPRESLRERIRRLFMG